MPLPWFKIDTDGWLKGSVRVDLTTTQRGIWIDLLALASSTRLRDGTLRFAVGKPMPRSWIASTLCISEGELDDAVDACRRDRNEDDERSMIEVWDDGTIELTNFDRYQAVTPDKLAPDDARAKELRERRMTRRLVKQYKDEAQDVLRKEERRALKSLKVSPASRVVHPLDMADE